MVSRTRKRTHTKRSKMRSRRSTRRYQGGVKRKAVSSLEYDEEDITTNFVRLVKNQLDSGNITTLSITNADGSPSPIKQLATVIGNCHSLLHVVIEIPVPILHMPDDTYHKFATVMRNHPSIQTFSLTVPFIDYSYWADVLRENTVLKRLILLTSSVPHTTHAMIDDIVDGIRENHTLEALTLKLGSLNNNHASAICDALRTNINGRIRRLLIQYENPEHQRRYDAAIEQRDAERKRMVNLREQERVAPILNEQTVLPKNVSNMVKQYVSGNNIGQML